MSSRPETETNNQYTRSVARVAAYGAAAVVGVVTEITTGGFSCGVAGVTAGVAFSKDANAYIDGDSGSDSD